MQKIKTDTISYKRFIFIGFELLTSNPNLVTILCCLGCSKISAHFGGPVEYLVRRFLFFSKQLLTHYRIFKLENHPLPVTRDCLFNVFAAEMNIWRPSLHPQPENGPCLGDKGPT
jgi:hypothetical protein